MNAGIHACVPQPQAKDGVSVSPDPGVPFRAHPRFPASPVTFSIRAAFSSLPLRRFSVIVTLRMQQARIGIFVKSSRPAWILLSAAFLAASGVSAQQAAPPVIPLPSAATAPVTVPDTPAPAVVSDAGMQALLGFQPSEVRFRVDDLMDILRDRRHEGWVLTAYPDPKTSRPLIGAGFSLDLPERPHPQDDPLNPHPFLEPSSAQLWQAAGLGPARLEEILASYHERLDAWGSRRFRRHMIGLDPDISGADADSLLRIGIVQAIENARAYCRNFDDLTASQQMALTQLVYQMGVNLVEFDHFLSLINSSPDPSLVSASALSAAPPADTDRWSAIQAALEQSQWARLYRTRAVAVIAMLDPRYADSPSLAESRIAATLHPAVAHRRRGHAGPALRAASTGHQPHPRARSTRSSHARRKV
jgi:hypothetical protein